MRRRASCHPVRSLTAERGVPLKIRPLRVIAVLVIATLLVAGCSKAAPREDQPIKKPQNVSKGPETLAPAPTALVEDTPHWTELPKPVADVFAASKDKGKFQAFAAMKQTTIAVRLKSAPKDQDVYRALDAATAFVPADYSILLHVYAPGSDGKDRYAGYEWTPLTGVIVHKLSADTDQGWDAAITAITQGAATSCTPVAVKAYAAGQGTPPVFK